MHEDGFGETKGFSRQPLDPGPQREMFPLVMFQISSFPV
jgi:hypothetical protein